MLFAGWEVRTVKNCDRGLENAARGRSFSRGKTHASVTVTVVRDRKIRTALRTNQIAEIVTVTAWKKINCIICKHHSCIIINEHPHKDFVYVFFLLETG